MCGSKRGKQSDLPPRPPDQHLLESHLFQQQVGDETPQAHIFVLQFRDPKKFGRCPDGVVLCRRFEDCFLPSLVCHDPFEPKILGESLLTRPTNRDVKLC